MYCTSRYGVDFKKSDTYIDEVFWNDTHQYEIALFVDFTSLEFTLKGNTSVSGKLIKPLGIVANGRYLSPCISH